MQRTQPCIRPKRCIIKKGGVKTKEKIVHPLPFSIFSSQLAIFAFKKNRKGAGDIASGKDEIYFEDDLKFKENGDIDYDGDTLTMARDGAMPEDPELNEGVVAINSKKIEEMNGTIRDINTRLEKFDIVMKGVKNDSDGLKEEIVQMNDSIKKMLCIYEAITQQYNPFIDDVPTVNVPAHAPTQKRPQSKDDIVDDEPLDRIIKPEDFEDDEPRYDPNLTDLVDLNTSVRDHTNKKEEPIKNVSRSPCSLSNDKITVHLEKDTITVTPSPAPVATTFNDVCRDQISKVLDLMNEKAKIEELVDRVYIQKMSGQPISTADRELMREWCRKNGG